MEARIMEVTPKIDAVVRVVLQKQSATDWSVEVDGQSTIFSSSNPVFVQIPKHGVGAVIVVENRTSNPMWVDERQQLWMLDPANGGDPTRVPMDPPPQPPKVSIAVTHPLIHPPEQGRAEE